MTDSTGPSNPHEFAFYSWAVSQGWQVTKQGWPDFICRRGDEVMAVEVKGGNDGVSSYQWATLKDLRLAGLPAFLWTPESGLQDGGLPATTESVLMLQAENARLRTLLEAANSRAAPQPRLPDAANGRWADEKALVLAYIADGCWAQHQPGHWGPGRRGRLRLCPWILQVSDKLEPADIAERTGLKLHSVQRLLEMVRADRDRFLERLYQDFPKRPQFLKRLGEKSSV